MLSDLIYSYCSNNLSSVISNLSLRRSYDSVRSSNLLYNSFAFRFKSSKWGD